MLRRCPGPRRPGAPKGAKMRKFTARLAQPPGKPEGNGSFFRHWCQNTINGAQNAKKATELEPNANFREKQPQNLSFGPFSTEKPKNSMFCAENPTRDIEFVVNHTVLAMRRPETRGLMPILPRPRLKPAKGSRGSAKAVRAPGAKCKKTRQFSLFGASMIQNLAFSARLHAINLTPPPENVNSAKLPPKKRAQGP